MNKIDRRSFLTWIAGSAVSCAVPDVLAKPSASEFDKCKNDILYFAEHYIKIPAFDNGDHALYDIQEQYLKNIASNSLFICKKSRQAGITKMNVIYAMWKSLFFEKQNIDMVFHKYASFQCLKNTFADMNLYDDSFKHACTHSDGLLAYALGNGNTIRFMTYNEFAEAESVIGKHNIFILDELAFCNNQFAVYNAISRRWFWQDNTMIAVSTPSSNNDAFSRLYDGAAEDHKMTITIDDFPKAIYTHKDELKSLLGEKAFNREYMCEV